MTPFNLLKQLAAFLRELLADYNAARGKSGEIVAPQVYEWYLPFKNGKTTEDVDFPYVTARITAGEDPESPVENASTVNITLEFGVYSAGTQKGNVLHPDGAYDLLNLMDYVRVALFKKSTIGGRFMIQRPYSWSIPEEQPYPLWNGVALTTWMIQTVTPEDFERGEFLHG